MAAPAIPTPAGKQRRKSKHPVLKTAVFLIVAIAVIAVIAGGNSPKSKAPSSPAQPAAQPFTATNAQMAAAVTSAVDSDDDAADVSGTPVASCPQSGDAINCRIVYTIKEPAGLSAALELIDPTRGFFKTAFSDAKMASVTATVSGPATSVGGKTSTTPLFTLSCDRAADSQIDWDNVGVSGLKTLCQYTAHVSGLNN